MLGNMTNLGKIRKILSVALLVSAVGSAHAGRVAIGDYSGNRVILADDLTGAFMGTMASGGGLTNPMGFSYGPDGLLYVSSYGTNQIKRYTEAGVFVDNFQTTPKPHGLAFYDRDLVVANRNMGTLSRFGLVSWVSPPNTARLYQAVVVRAGRIYASFNSNIGGGIEEFDPASGTTMGDVIAPGRGIWDIQGFAWGPDNNWYVTSSNNQRIYRYSPNGDFLGFVAVPGQPLGIKFNSKGELLSTVWAQTNVAKLQVPSLTVLGNLLPSTVSLTQPWYIERVNPSIDCKITFGDRTNPVPPVSSVTVEIGWPGSGVTIQSRTVPLNSDGTFSVLSPQFLGEYDLRVKIGTFLQRTVRIDSRDASKSTAEFILVNGDADGSNTIDAADYRLVQSKVGTWASLPTWDARADLDGDGYVTNLDLKIVSSKYALTGRGQ